MEEEGGRAHVMDSAIFSADRDGTELGCLPRYIPGRCLCVPFIVLDIVKFNRTHETFCIIAL